MDLTVDEFLEMNPAAQEMYRRASSQLQADLWQQNAPVALMDLTYDIRRMMAAWLRDNHERLASLRLTQGP